LSLVYLLLAFPLGLFYFIVLVTGLSLGLGLTIILWGIPVLLGLATAWWHFAKLERWLTTQLLGARIGPMRRRALDGLSRTEQLKAHFGNRVTWTSLVYLFLAFPFGTLALALAVGFLSLSLASIVAPAYYHWTNIKLFDDSDALWIVDTWWEAALLSLAGVLLLGVTLVLIYGLARAWRAVAEVLLGYPEEELTRDVALDAPVLSARSSPTFGGDALSQMI
jgi:hypothetical protein